MKTVLAVARHPLAGPVIRYGVTGSTVAVVYLGLPLLLNGTMGVSIELAIPIAYIVAVAIHFNLQRSFVFSHVPEFALSRREQMLRYLGMFAIQYPLTALSTGLLPDALAVSPRVVFVCTALSMSLAVFIVLRTHVFHGGEGT